MPSYSIGLAVARTWKGTGSRCVCPSTVTCPSCIASSRAAWVLGGVRLISSASRSPVKIGPGRKSNSARRWSYTYDPVRSAGSRSGVNCARAKSRPRAPANDRAASVLPRPGKSSSRTCPLARMPASTRDSASRLPTTARPTSSSTRSANVATDRSGSVTGFLDSGQDAVDLRGRQASHGVELAA